MIINTHAKGSNTRHVNDTKSVRLSGLEVECCIDMIIDQARFYPQQETGQKKIR